MRRSRGLASSVYSRSWQAWQRREDVTGHGRIQFKRYVSDTYTLDTAGGKARMSVLKVPGYFGHYTSRVNRPSNEDRYSAGVLTLPRGSSLLPASQRRNNARNTRNVFNFSVFDGHGGAQCSEFLHENLLNYIESQDLKQGPEIRELYKNNIGGYWKAWGRNQIEKYVQNLTSLDDLQLRVPLAFLRADYDFISQNDQAGSTCTSVFLYSQDENKNFWDDDQIVSMFIGHVGDTRAILVDRHGHAYQLTTAHHPSSPVENSRLRRYAASFFTDSFGEERFGAYANTRAFGDKRAKARGVSAEPEIVEARLGATESMLKSAKQSFRNRHIRTFTGGEAFLVLMTDGVSDMLNDHEVADIAICAAEKGGTPQTAARDIVHFAEAVGGDDNATALVIRLPGWGKWTQWTDRTKSSREQKIRSAIDKRPMW